MTMNTTKPNSNPEPPLSPLAGSENPDEVTGIDGRKYVRRNPMRPLGTGSKIYNQWGQAFVLIGFARGGVRAETPNFIVKDMSWDSVDRFYEPADDSQNAPAQARRANDVRLSTET
jgi:hypothetical protein